jgi:hypothetical protein
MRFHLKPALLAGLALLTLGAAPALAQADSPLRGTFVRDEAASDPMKKIVDDGMSMLGRVYRVWPISGQARKRLQETNRPMAWIQIVPEERELTVTTDRYKLVTPPNGVLEDWERQEGDFVDVTSQLQGPRLEQRFVAEDGERVNRYSLSPDGNTLTLDVTVTSPKLDGELTYRQVYRRRP